MTEKRFFVGALTVGILGLVVAVASVIYRSGSDAPVLVILAAATGTAVIAAIVGAYFAYTNAKYQRLREKSMRQTQAVITAIPGRVQGQLRDLLRAAAEEVATQQELERSQVRAALLLPDGQSLRMTPNLTWHMDDPREFDIRIGLGQGSSGRALLTRKPNVAIYHDAHSDSSLPEEERLRVDANLKWIISTPILGKDETVVAVLNVDGLIPRSQEDLVKSAGNLVYWAQLAGLILGEPSGTSEEVP
jgi:hypothetical protein